MDAGSDTEAAAVAGDEKVKRERSKIDFPYSDLESVLEVARILNNNTGGAPAEDIQLAAWMNQSASGGTFRSRLSSARLFGLIEILQGRISLTSLGREILDDAKFKGAMVEAFLRVPLFAAMYEQYKGYSLPPPAALERQMESLGVSSKVKDRARQTFTKSANSAGFIDPSSGKFVKPAHAAPAPATAANKHEEEGTNGKRNGGGGGRGGQDDPDLHPFIQGLLKTLPKTKGDDAAPSWPTKDRVKWLQTAASIFGLIYADDKDGDISITVKDGR
jgi:hypothetical protein